MTHGKHDWSDWGRWCDARIDLKRSFDREVLIEVVADLKGMIEDQEEKLKAQTEKLQHLELKLAELVGANDLRSAEDQHIGVKVAEHQIAIAELRHLVSAERAKLIDPPETLQRRGLN